MTHRFYKDKEGWFIDLPELIKDGTFSKSNLAMVAGADELLDIMTKGKKEITLRFEERTFKGWDTRLKFQKMEKDEDLLEELGHPIEWGGDYVCTELFGKPYLHKLWLCQVCAFLFEGKFPKDIFIKKEENV